MRSSQFVVVYRWAILALVCQAWVFPQLGADVIAQGVVVQSLPAEPIGDWHDPNFWETLDGQPVQSGWEFAGDEIRLRKPRGYANTLVSGPVGPHFELSWRWKIDAGTNTGIKYRARPYSGRWFGIEYQIIDQSSDATGKGATASIYDLFAPGSASAVLPAGQWNLSRIVAVGHRIEHYLNGSLVAAADIGSPPWESAIALSKFWGKDDFGYPRSDDRILLTDHGGTVTYKDFQFVRCEAPQEAPVTRQGPFLGNAFRNSWADQDSIVLWTRTTAHPDLNSDGLPFIEIDRKTQATYAKQTDEDKLLSVQLPEGADLDDMFGACPGAAGEVRLTYFPVAKRKQSKTTPWTATSADSDFTMQWALAGLLPGSDYVAVVEARTIDGDAPSAVVRGGFRTAPKINQAEPLTFCMTTCHDFIRRDDGLKGHKIYPSMSQMNPDFVVHAGDIEYYDKPAPWAWTRALMRFKWARIFALPNNRSFYQQTTSYFLKDDHDTLKNDCWAGQSYGSVTFDEGVRIFNEEQFPSHDPRYKTVRWGRDLQVWFLEGRDYRSPNNLPDGPEKTILGERQKQWLFSTLAESDAAFKLVFSPTPIVGPDRKNKRDNHANDVFAHEGVQMRAELSKHDGVVVFCGDRHWQYASVDADSGLWEFGCGPGSEEHQLGWKKGDERPIHRFLRVAGGYLSGQLSYAEQTDQPTLTINHRTVTGEVVSTFAFPQ